MPSLSVENPPAAKCVSYCRVESPARLARGEPGTSALGLRDTPSSHTNLPDPSRLGGLPGGVTSLATCSLDRQRLRTAGPCTDRELQVADAGSPAHDGDSVRLAARARWLLAGPRSWRRPERAPKPDTSTLAALAPRAGELGKAGCRLECGSTHSGCLPGCWERGTGRVQALRAAAFQSVPCRKPGEHDLGVAPVRMAPCKLDLYSPCFGVCLSCS